MKTAMQDVLNLVEQMFANAKTIEVESAMNDIINIITQEGLEKEKEQIMEAYRQGLQDYTKHDEGEVIRKEQYYNETYKNEG
jgi:hypothetical protein